MKSKKLDKIFQPFFTIIPIAPDSYRDGTTAQGTGLGLSISYAIVKAYSDELSVVLLWRKWKQRKEKKEILFYLYHQDNI